MYLLITLIASLLVGLVLVYLVLTAFDREPAAPGRPRRQRRAAHVDQSDDGHEEQQGKAQ
ncbi:hypothetical protein BJF89_01720 [Corynebacterium sp. CNJ-954]|uniref:hypothetical protein n=1 Tax=Corynebacterium sp. CNJ-954 TaxID=1904962 RepID=UPI00095CB4FF|nr:hypothetical protein [Corynebacterium sp. CNJ-954]OLT54958.1 hypothetical protein BJF89_01720 [Corynebacterium sp. CNJ-954]